VPVVVGEVEIQVERQTQLSGLANLLAVEVHAMPTRREVADAYKHEIVIYPKTAKRLALGMEIEKKRVNVRFEWLPII
jgi:hypothetical protein